MRRLILYLFIILSISAMDINSFREASECFINDNNKTGIEQNLSPMEALDLVQEHYAANFDKVYKDSEDEYYYKLVSADYYLVYEGEVGPDRNYLIHLYEIVIDEPETGLGHIYTYGWYTVDRKSGSITEKTD